MNHLCCNCQRSVSTNSEFELSHCVHPHSFTELNKKLIIFLLNITSLNNIRPNIPSTKSSHFIFSSNLLAALVSIKNRDGRLLPIVRSDSEPSFIILKCLHKLIKNSKM